MASAALKDEMKFSVGEIGSYFELVADHLEGVDHRTSNFLNLNTELKALLVARAEHRAGRAKSAIEILDQLESNPSIFVRAESGYVKGFVLFGSGEFLGAQRFFQLATNNFAQMGLKSRELLAKFNVAQCHFNLSDFEMASTMEIAVYHQAEALGLQNVMAMCLRSMAYDNIRQKNWERASELYNRAEQLLKDLRNVSEWSLVYCYRILIALKRSVPVDHESFAATSQRFAHARAIHFADFIKALLEVQDRTTLAHRLQNCERDVRQAVAWIDLAVVPAVEARPPKSRAQLGLKLITFLQQRERADSYECIGHLWPGQSNFESLRKRFWTLIYRMNRDRKLIASDAHGRYYLI